MNSKTKQILKWTTTTLVTIAIVMSASMKLANAAPLIEIYSKIGLLPYLGILGATEIAFVALFLWSRTMKIGFFLLTGYFGGAMAVEMSHGTIFIAPGTFLTMIWIATYLRDPSLFTTVRKQDSLLNSLSGIH